MRNSLSWIEFKEGNDSSFSQLYEEYIDSLYRYGMKFFKNEDVVKDCIHDLFVKLYQNRTNLPDTENPLLFLFVSLKNSIVDKLRREEKFIRLSPMDPDFYVDFYLDQEENSSDIEERFHEVVNALSPRQKEAIYLRYQMEMSYDEIAILLNINPQSARNLVYRTIEKIRSRISFTVFLFLFLSLEN